MVTRKNAHRHHIFCAGTYRRAGGEGRLAERATMAMGSVSGTKCRETTMAVNAWWEIVDAWLYGMISESDFYISQFATSL